MDCVQTLSEKDLEDIVAGRLVVTYFGDRIYYNGANELHREDGPAVIRKGGNLIWYKDGKVHRDNGPAFECVNGYKAWYQYGKRHKEDGPAVINRNGTEEYWLNGNQVEPF